VLVRLLSEFLEPDARAWFQQGEAQVGWVIRGEGAVERLSGEDEVGRA
jgi:hypothetical protein